MRKRDNELHYEKMGSGSYRNVSGKDREIRDGKRRTTGLNKRAVMLLFCAFIVSMAATIFFYNQDRKQEMQFEELAKLEEQDRDNISYDGKGSIAPSLPLIDSPDCIGWIKIDGTTVSYPIMQHEGDGEYYLHRDYKGEYSFYGTPFLDIRCTTDSDNCIIYGHNITSHKMFGALHAYSDQKYYEEHPDIRVRFGDNIYTYQIVAVIPTTTSDKLYEFTEAGNWDEYKEYVELILNEALYQTEMGEEIRAESTKVSAEKLFKRYRFVTLSTCRTWVGRDARIIIIAVKEVSYSPTRHSPTPLSSRIPLNTGWRMPSFLEGIYSTVHTRGDIHTAFSCPLGTSGKGHETTSNP